MPAGIHAGGLRYHGMSPLVSLLHEEGIVEAVAYHQNPVFEAALTFARAEGITPAPESAHAIKAAIDQALEAKEAGQERVILFNLSGNGYLDLGSYEAYLSGNLDDYEYPVEDVQKAIAALPAVEPAMAD
jgi:tryptophan synthase beta chain